MNDYDSAVVYDILTEEGYDFRTNEEKALESEKYDKLYLQEQFYYKEVEGNEEEFFTSGWQIFDNNNTDTYKDENNVLHVKTPHQDWVLEEMIEDPVLFLEQVSENDDFSFYFDQLN